MKLIVIHGMGSTLKEAALLLDTISEMKINYEEGVYYISGSGGAAMSRLIREEEDENPYVQALKMLFLAKLLEASVLAQAPKDKNADLKKVYESSLNYKYSGYGLPIEPNMRLERAELMEKQAKETLAPLYELNEKFLSLGAEKELGETEAIRKLNEFDMEDGLNGGAYIELLKKLRGLNESGGDLDTVGSASMYTLWLKQKAKEEGRELVYGKDYKYVYINYNSSMKHFAEHGECGVLMADFPTGALPTLEEDVRFLHERGVKIERFEDHHPYTKEQLKTFKKLQGEGLVGFVSLSGDCLDADDISESEELKCGTDMVYESCIESGAADNEAVRELRKAAHSEDFVTDRYDLGMTLTALIKGGFCKIELVETIVESFSADDDKAEKVLLELLQGRGYTALTEQWEQYFEDVKEGLLQHAYMLEVERPIVTGQYLGGKSYGEGSDAPIPINMDEEEGKGPIRLLVVMAYQNKPGQPKVHVGRAIQYYKRIFPEADYIFYCYGASILVARRLNQADYSLNMSLLMPKIGSKGDGGHEGASVGRPEANEDFPKQLLQRVNNANFRSFVEYIVWKLNKEGVHVLNLKDRSVQKERAGVENGRKALIALSLVSIAAGLILAIFFPQFSRESIEESNEGFMKQIEIIEKLDSKGEGND